MLRNVRGLQHYTVHATDGDIGRVHEFYFDDQQWTVRHAVVNVGHWLPRHRVLVPTVFLDGIDEVGRELHVHLTKSQVASSPIIDTEKPVSRQHEGKLYWYYGFTGSALPSHFRTGAGDPHLRCTREVIGYFVHGDDEHVGEVDDFLVDDDSWGIRYLVMDVQAWWPGRKVLVPPRWIVCIRWEEKAVHITLSLATVRTAPRYDAARPIDPDYEARLQAHYEQSKQLKGGRGAERQPVAIPS